MRNSLNSTPESRRTFKTWGVGAVDTAVIIWSLSDLCKKGKFRTDLVVNGAPKLDHKDLVDLRDAAVGFATGMADMVNNVIFIVGGSAENWMLD